MTASEQPACELDAATLRDVREWLERFIQAPHSNLGREGAVCPFVEPAARQGSLVIRIHESSAATQLSELKCIARDYADQFQSQQAARAPRSLQALLVVFRGLRPAELLDSVHAELKTSLVQRGLMLGQFYPGCPVPGVHNPEFRPMRAPLPMLAFRNLALHDILFLDQDPTWFAAYDNVFGAHYQRPASVDALYARLYHHAAARFGSNRTPARDSVSPTTPSLREPAA